MRRDLINTAILWFVLTFIAELLLPSFPFPLEAAQEARFSDESFRVLLVLGAPVFTFVVAVMAYSLWKFRARGDTLEDGVPIRSNPWVSGVWLAITGGLCLLVIVHPGLTGLAKFAGNQQAQLVVKVTGRQWAWDVGYPAQGIVHAPELVLPVGQRVEFQVTSSDVLHSFWIPAFRDKIDAVPGQVTTMYITPDQIGAFEQDYNLRVQCAEICGMSHAIMSMPVRIVSAQDFQTWALTQAPPTDPVKRGELLAKSQGCAACHSTDGSTLIGPTWKGLYGSQVTLADGTTVTADDAYLRESIVDPNAKIVKGFSPNIMPPSFGKTLTPDQISDLIAYIKSLSAKAQSGSIAVALKDYSITLSAQSAPAGSVTFNIANQAAQQVHEFLVVKTDLSGSQLPLDANGDVDETKLNKMGGMEDIDPGKGGDLTINLPAGHYVLLCNRAGHCKMGMYTEFTVAP